MKIQDDWQIDDVVSGLRIQIICGKKLNWLHIEELETRPLTNNRDFYFDKEGKFDGTGSTV